MRRIVWLCVSLQICISGPVAAIASMSGALGPGNEIFSIDFRNFTYPDPCGEPGKAKVTIHGGGLNVPIPAHEQLPGRPIAWTRMEEIGYGWIEHEPDNVAVVALVCSGGGTGIFSEAYLVAIRSGKPSVVADIGGGDRGDGGIAGASVAWGRILVERYAVDDPGYGICCPTHLVTTVYRWTGKKLVQVSSGSQAFGLP